MKYKEAYSGNNKDCRDFLLDLFYEFLNGTIQAQDKMRIVPTDEDIEYKVKYGRDELRIKLYSNHNSKEKENNEEEIKEIKEKKINIKEEIKEEIKKEVRAQLIEDLKEKFIEKQLEETIEPIVTNDEEL